MSKISLVSKVTMIATLFALAAFSATNVFAAGSTTTATSTQATVLEQSWKAESSAIQLKSEVLSRFDRKSDNIVFRNGLIVRRDEQGKADAQLGSKMFSMWLSKAEAIISTHAGFDASGMVTDQVMAAKSVQDLAKYLDELRETKLSLVPFRIPQQ